ncbi:MAG: hypothetical protein JSU94_08165, partial [Phycisphaerales bacterium]
MRLARIERLWAVALCLCILSGRPLWAAAGPVVERKTIDGAVAKKVLGVKAAGRNLLKADAWRPWQKGFERDGG